MTAKVPLWTALILAIALAYYVTRPDSIGDTKIVYVERWKPPIVRKPLPFAKLVQYLPVPKGELRTDTIYVPVNYTRYQLWKPSEVRQRDNSIVVRSFDLDTSTYRDYQYKPVQAKFGVNLSVSLMTSVFAYEPALEIEAGARYKRLSVVGRAGISDEPYVVGGVRYSIK